MSDHNERACTNCGSLLHREEKCPKPYPAADGLCPYCKGDGFITNGLKTSDPDYKEEDCCFCNATGKLEDSQEEQDDEEFILETIYENWLRNSNSGVGIREFISYVDTHYIITEK